MAKKLEVLQDQPWFNKDTMFAQVADHNTIAAYMPPDDDNNDLYDYYKDIGFTDSSGSLIDDIGFANPDGRSALQVATPDNPCIYACPHCGTPDVLTRTDVQRGYQCDACTCRLEQGWY